MKLELGQTVKDVITGFEGVVTARFDYLHGCSRLEVSPRKLNKKGRLIEAEVFDEQRLALIDAPNVLEEVPLTDNNGGYRPAPPRR